MHLRTLIVTAVYIYMSLKWEEYQNYSLKESLATVIYFLQLLLLWIFAEKKTESMFIIYYHNFNYLNKKFRN